MDVMVAVGGGAAGEANCGVVGVFEVGREGVEIERVVTVVLLGGGEGGVDRVVEVVEGVRHYNLQVGGCESGVEL